MLKVEKVAFIGLGVMGEPMCRNLAVKSGLRIFGFDKRTQPLRRLNSYGVVEAKNLREALLEADVVLMCLPSGAELEELSKSEDGLLSISHPGQTLVDLGTSPVELTRKLADSFLGKGVMYSDAPVSRTRSAAEAGTLSSLVGGEKQVFDTILPLLECFSEEVIHCGNVGSGQIVKQLNNMILTETVVALAEALSLGRRAGLDDKLLFETLSKCSADSFALRNHGMKALLPGKFPKQAFSSAYMLKDINYALELAEENGLALPAASLARKLLQKTVEAGYADDYFPSLIRVLTSYDK
ncbi:MAG: 2-hydroxy-3-oxopropionate reductase [Magnetovibrio sp.]|nr:2-hydroxy-3-oxopropionate reductase [Magnetovibrio sp.]|tara:strand:+ start:299 stop:1189 length:891 start_codon:yes stop_codon:yes gene_type:complete